MNEPKRVEHPSLAAALAAFQAQVPKVVKASTAKLGSYSYQFADLAEVTETAMPLLGAHGLSFTARPTLSDGVFALHYALTHENGESLDGVYPLPDPTKVKPQELGSAITFARRYVFCAVTGVAPGGDDDDAHTVNVAAAASAPARPAAPHPAKPALERRDPKQDWISIAGEARSKTELRTVYQMVEDAGDMRVAVGDGDDVVSLRDWLFRLRDTLPDETPDEPVVVESTGELVGDWPTVDVKP